jgi:hypothetical protein
MDKAKAPSSLTRRATNSQEARLAALNDSKNTSAGCRTRKLRKRAGKALTNSIAGSWQNEENAERMTRNSDYR